MKKWSYVIMSQRISDIGCTPMYRRGRVSAPNGLEACIRAIASRHDITDHPQKSFNTLVDDIDAHVWDGFKEELPREADGKLCTDIMHVEYHYAWGDFGAEVEVAETDDVTIALADTIARVFIVHDHITVGANAIDINIPNSADRYTIKISTPDIIFIINGGEYNRISLADPKSLDKQTVLDAFAQALTNHGNREFKLAGRMIKLACHYSWS